MSTQPTTDQPPPPWGIEFQFAEYTDMTLPMIADRIMSLEPLLLYADLPTSAKWL